MKDCSGAGGTCKICNSFVKSSGNTTNLKNHLIRKHPSKWSPNTGTIPVVPISPNPIPDQDQSLEVSLFLYLMILVNKIKQKEIG